MKIIGLHVAIVEIAFFGNLTTQEELKKAKEYWYSKMISEKINDIELL